MHRLALVALAVVGCMPQDPPPPSGGGYYPPSSGGGGGGGGFTGCESDTQCPTGNVCANDGECVPPADVMTVHVSWTLQGQPASTTTCANNDSLELDFTSGQGRFGYAPVPCMEGLFTVPKLPTWYTSVQLGIEYDPAQGSGATIPSSGTVALDLPF